MRQAPLLLTILLFAACTMGPDYQRPPIQVPDAFRMADGTEGESIANLPWWRLLRDQALQKLIRIALQENGDLMRATAAVEEYQARLLVSRTDFAPQLSTTGNAPFRRQSRFVAPGFPSLFNNYAQGALSWELDIWGRIRRSNEAALGDLLSREENRRAVVLQLVTSVAEAYMDLLQFDMQLDIAKRTIASRADSLHIAQVRLSQGVISELDADQFEAALAGAQARAAELERQRVQKENQLSMLMGRAPQPIARGPSLTELVLPPEVPPGLPSELLQRRPDIVQAEQEMAAATARIGVAKADRFPRIALTGFLGVASPNLKNLTDDESTFGAVGPNLTGPLFNAQILGFQQEAAEAQARQALAQYKITVLTAFKEVEDALVAVRTARQQRDAQAKQVNALRAALRLANLRYEGGVTSYLDVLVAQQNLFDAELALTDVHRLHLVSIVQLYKALGGGWPADFASEGTPPARSDG